MRQVCKIIINFWVERHAVATARSGVPIARLVPWWASAPPVVAPGAMRGRIQITDDFDAPLDELFQALR